jgi:uncharacterized membrane-anchored protein
MTTKSPSAVQDYSAASLEKIAYASVSSIPTEEPNDRNRLGYHIWRWLVNREGSLEQAIVESRARIHISQQDTEKVIQGLLMQQGIKFE